MTRRFARFFLPFAAAAALAGMAIAQDGTEKSGFEKTLEGMISTPDRKVSITGLEGAFSSEPTIQKLTISDRAGPWLEIDGIKMVWSRMALMRRHLDIDSLAAEHVVVLRKPAPSEAPSSGGSGGLPVDVTIKGFQLPDVSLGAPVVGIEARLSAEGSAEATQAAMAARLSVERKDRPGTFSADLRFEPQNNVLAAGVKLSEPEGGLLAELARLKGRPAVSVSLQGKGPLSNWQAELEMQAGGARVLAGSLDVLRVATGYRLTGDLSAELTSFVPDEYAGLIAGDSRLAFDVTRGDDKAIAVTSASLHSAGADLSANGVLSPDLVPQSAELSLKLGQAGRTTLPFVPGGVSVARLEVTAGLDAGTPAPWRAEVSAAGVESAFGALGELSLMATGEARNLADPAARATTFRLGGSASGVQPADPAVAAALGTTARIMGSGSWAAGQPVAVESMEAVLTGATAMFSGTASVEELQGRLSASVMDLARFTPIAKRPLSGRAELQASGKLTPRGGGFDLQLSGTTTDLKLGIASLDPLLAGETRVQGGIARSDGRLSFRDLALQNARATAKVSGNLAAPDLDLSVDATLADLASLSPRAQGQASLSARITGTNAAPHVEADVSGERVVLMGRPLEGASMRFNGTIAGPQTEGEAEIKGSLGGLPIAGSARLAAGEGGARQVQNLLLTAGESRASGDLTLGGDGLVSGRLAVVSPDLSKVAPLFLVEASGALTADVTLAAEGGQQNARFSATATNLAYEKVTLQSAQVSGDARNLRAAPQIDGKFSLSNLTASGLKIVSASGTAQRQGNSTAISADAKLADGSATFRGSLSPSGQGLAIALQAFSFTRSGVSASLAQPTTITVEKGTARFAATTLNAGGGKVTLAGQAGSTLDLNVQLTGVPAALANAFVPNLGAEGSISGTATVTGAAAAPNARFNASWQGASVAAARNAGLGALSVTADGTLAGRTVKLTGKATGGGGLSVQVAGSIGATAGGALDLKVTGAVPLSLANARLADRGAALQGTANLDLAVTGTTAAPRFAGRVTAEGASFADPGSGVTLRSLSLAASLSNDRLTVERLTGQSGKGTLTASGSIGLLPGSGFPADLKAEIRRAHYADGTLVATTFDADLTLTGSLVAGPTLGGSVTLDRTEITVPERLPRGSVAVDVKHIHTPPAVQKTLTLARDRSAEGKRGGSAIVLDLKLDAPREIFVRGRGIDAEMGGHLTVRGSLSALIADGAFEMRRGRVDLLTQRITFDRGTITFAGDLDPVLDFSGSTSTQDITVTVTVTGDASDPQIGFSSSPELPQDEILAHLIFNKGIADLSPVQIARLASVVTGGSLLNRLRESTGLDDLDIVTDQTGGAALAAGRYISDNVYLGVQQGTGTGSTRVTVDLDVTKEVKVRGAVSPDGDSSLGVYFEHEY